MSEQEQQQPPLTAKEALARNMAERPWQTWLLLRSRQLAFALAMLIMLVFLLVTGGGEPVKPQ